MNLEWHGSQVKCGSAFQGQLHLHGRREREPVSFDYDPYAVMTVVTRKNDEGKPVGYSFLCDSCGGGWREMIGLDGSIATLRRGFDVHIATGHNLSREDTKRWHQGH